MRDSKAVYAAIGAVVSGLIIANVPIEGLESSAYHIRVLVETLIQVGVTALGGYWAAWFAPANDEAAD